MKKLFALLPLLCVGVILSAQQQNTSPVTLSARVLPDGSRSLLLNVQQISGQVDEVIMELPGEAAKNTVLMSAPAGWRLAAEGNAIRITGAAITAPFKLRATVF